MTDPPVVLLHGLATSAHATWVETGWCDLLRDECRSPIVLDLPGHGASPALEDWDQLEDWVDGQLPAGPLDAVGFSLGARILLTLAGRTPDRFDRIVVAGVGANLFRTDDHSALRAGLTEGGSEHPVVGHFHQLASQHGTDIDAIVAILQRSWPPLALDKITAEVLVVLGDEDFAGPAEPLLAALGDRARFVSLPRVDHFATPKSMGFLDAGLRFLQRP